MADQKRYATAAIALHWLIAALVFAGFGVGLYMHELPLSPQKLKLYNYHKWMGVTVFLLALLRALWRATHPAPPLPEGSPAWQRYAARLTHLALYLLMFAIPLSGWLYSSASGYQVVYFGVLPLPDLLARDAALAPVLRQLHAVLAWTLAALLTVHVGAALKHHFVDRDDVLRRMLPRFSRS